MSVTHSLHCSFMRLLFLRLSNSFWLNLRAPNLQVHLWHVYVSRSHGSNPSARHALQTRVVP
eukprot:9295926-Pyramimonas_sp.AAC.1